MKPRVFVGSSRESLEYARAIQLELEHDMHVSLWDQGIFHPGDYTLHRLLQQSERFHFGIFVFSPDDVVKMRKEEYLAARDNVVFEFGLFVSRMGPQRAFFITPSKTEGFHLPTDLMGVTAGSYDPDRIPRDNVTAMDLQPVFAPPVARIRSTIQQQWQVLVTAAGTHRSVDFLAAAPGATANLHIVRRRDVGPGDGGVRRPAAQVSRCPCGALALRRDCVVNRGRIRLLAVAEARDDRAGAASVLYAVPGHGRRPERAAVGPRAEAVP